LVENIAALIEEKEVSEKSKPKAKRLTSQNVWEEINLLNDKVDSLSARVEALDLLGVKLDKVETKVDSLRSLGTKIDSVSAKVNSLDSVNGKVDAVGAKVDTLGTEVYSLGKLGAKMDSLSARVDSLAISLKAEQKEASVQKQSAWWGLFVVGTAVAAVGSVLLAIPQALGVGLGLVGIGAVVGAITGIRLWGKGFWKKAKS
jgi:prefoldin subunit 5